MLRLTLAFTVVLLAVLTFHVGSLAARNHAIATREAETANRTARLEAAERTKGAILEELSRADLPSWAGEYHRSDGYTSERLFLAPESGFAYFCRCCTGSDALSGHLIPAGDALSLAVPRPDDFCCGFREPKELVPASKGLQRFLLLGERDVVRAFNASRDGTLPFSTFAHVANTEPEPVGPLVVPPSFRKCQLDTPIVGRVTHAERVEPTNLYGSAGSNVLVRLDVGNDSRALVGMTFFVRIADQESGPAPERFTVESAESGGELELFTYLLDSKPLPRVGAIASTSPD